MIKEPNLMPSEEYSTSVLLDQLLSFKVRYSALGSAQPMTRTEKRHHFEAKQAVQCIGLENYVIPMPIRDEKSLTAIVEANASHISLDLTDWLTRYAFYFFLVPVRVKDQNFKEAFITLKCDHIPDAETQAPPLFYDLFPKTEFKDKAKWVQSLALNLAEWARLKTETPHLPAELTGFETSAGVDANVDSSVQISYSFEKTWRDVLIRASIPPTANAEWHFRDSNLLRDKTIPLAFILRMPKGLRKARISHSIKIKFNSPPWERTIARWIKTLQSKFADLTPEEQKQMSLVEGYVRTGIWAAEYTEDPRVWILDETDFVH